MTGFSRRIALGLGGAGLLGLAAFDVRKWPLYASEAKQRTRYDATSPEGKEMLKSYAKAVGIMKNSPEGSPLSWKFQWYTHWVDSATDKQAEIARVYGTDDSEDKMLALAMWGTCRGHDNGFQRNWFTPWHRMYVLFFEEIIRGVSGDGDFTLPYWDYTTPGKRAIPEEFRMKDDPLFAPLFVGDRNNGVNDGAPLDSLPLYPDLRKAIGQDPLGLECLNIRQFADSAPVVGFNARLDQAPHGMVHVLVGTDSNMGNVPTAANDPIFWLHHCNIDRIWASWNAAGEGRENPSGNEWLDMQFVFSDDQGKRVLGTTRDFTGTEALGYEFQEMLVPPSAAQTVEVATSATSEKAATTAPQAAIQSGEVKSLELGTRAATIELPFPVNATTLENSIGTELAKQRLYLVLRDLRMQAQPGVLYTVYLGPGGGENRSPVGVLNFFNALPMAAEAPEDGGQFYSFDVTEVAAEIASAAEDSPEVTVAPVGAPSADATPVVGEVFFVLR